MQPVILNLLPLTADEQQRFAALGGGEQIFADAQAVSDSDLMRAEVILGTPAPARLGVCRNLRLLQSFWSGTNEYLDVLPAQTMLAGAAGAYNTAVSEHACALLLAVCHKLPQCRDNQRKSLWQDQPQLKTLQDAVVLIWGAGQIAQALARRLLGLGCREVWGVRRSTSADRGALTALYGPDRIDRLLPQADAVVMILPDQPDTRGVMGRERLLRMKRDAVLINVGRGPSLDLLALNDVLAEGHLWGAAVDVTDPEPLNPDHPLWQRENCLITPHTAGGFRLPGTRQAALDICYDNLRRYLCGEALINLSKRG